MHDLFLLSLFSNHHLTARPIASPSGVSLRVPSNWPRRQLRTPVTALDLLILFVSRLGLLNFFLTMPQRRRSPEVRCVQ